MSDENAMVPVGLRYPADSSKPVLAEHPANIAVWADGRGVWHVRVSRNAAAGLVGVRRALRAELYARESRTTLLEPDIFMHPVRVVELDTDDTIVYRERRVGEEDADEPPSRRPLGLDAPRSRGELEGAEYGVIGDVTRTMTGNVAIRVGHNLLGGGWSQTEYVVLTPAERDELIALLEATR